YRGERLEQRVDHVQPARLGTWLPDANLRRNPSTCRGFRLVGGGDRNAAIDTEEVDRSEGGSSGMDMARVSALWPSADSVVCRIGDAVSNSRCGGLHGISRPADHARGKTWSAIS